MHISTSLEVVKHQQPRHHNRQMQSADSGFEKVFVHGLMVLCSGFTRVYKLNKETINWAISLFFILLEYFVIYLEHVVI